MIKLGARLNAILHEIDYVETVADIGTDHGKLVVSAVLSNRAKHAIATDISSFSLQKAKQLAIEYGVEDRLDFFVGDGLNPIKNRIDIAIIAGMGGLEIIKILHIDKAKKYILMPHQDGYFLRKFLLENDFFIVKDYVVEDGKFYDIIVAEKGQSNYTEKELFLGKNIPQSEHYFDRNTQRQKKIEQIIEKHKNANSNRPLSALLQKEYEYLKEETN